MDIFQLLSLINRSVALNKYRIIDKNSDPLPWVDIKVVEVRRTLTLLQSYLVPYIFYGHAKQDDGLHFKSHTKKMKITNKSTEKTKIRQ